MKRRTATWAFVAALLAGTTVVPGDAREVVELRVHGRYFVAPAAVRMLVAVEPDAENRILRVEADGESMYRASDITLNGAKEKRLHTVEFRGLSEGHYVLRAEVRSAQAVRGSASQELLVTGIGLR